MLLEYKDFSGVYIPTEEEAIECIENSKSCDFGICKECSIYSVKSAIEEIKNENE